METHVELGELGASAAKSCLPHHKCRTCERTRSVKFRVLSWILGKFSLMLIIVVTSATTTFLYHKLLPDDVKPGVTSPTEADDGEETRQADLRHSNLAERVALERLQGVPLGNKDPQPAYSSSSVITAARLGIQHLGQGGHLRMTGEDPQFFTSGHVRLEGGALLVQTATTLFLSADVILKSMGSPEVQTGPSTVVVCLSLVRGHDSRDKPITCHLTYLRERDQQVARVWILFQAEANDRIYVKSSWPSYVISDNKDQQQSVFTAFEVGHVAT